MILKNDLLVLPFAGLRRSNVFSGTPSAEKVFSIVLIGLALLLWCMCRFVRVVVPFCFNYRYRHLGGALASENLA